MATFVAIAGVIVITVLSMDPSNLLTTSTITGGDTGAHVALAWFLKTDLLPHLHVTGWDPGAYDGFPLFTFYFPLPDLLAALFGFVVPFTVAFKLVTILGSLTLPVAAWAFGRLAGLERPRPAVLAVATLPYLFDQTWTIYGGNLYSTMAGEYAYSLGLSAGLVFLGLVIRGMRTGRHRAVAAVLLAFIVLCHIIAALLALAGVGVAFLVLGPSWRRLWWGITVVGTGGLLVAFWALPFVFEQPFSTSMGYLNVTTYATLFAPSADRWALVLASIGLLLAVVRRDRAMSIVAIIGAGSAGAVVLDPQGKLYNTRFLPLWWLGVYLVAGYAVAELGVVVARWWRANRIGQMATASAMDIVDPVLPHVTFGEAGALSTSLASPSAVDPDSVPRRVRRQWSWAPGAVAVPLVSLAAAGAVVLPPLLISPTSSYQIGPLHLTADNVPSWASWNYSGYQGKPGWPEFEGLMDTMKQVGARYGCGRAMWEYNANENRFGTPEALMDLPYFTDNCIDSMEGLLFESAATTPYHFIDQSELSFQPSDPMVGLPYSPVVDVTEGVEHLQLLGVRYFMAATSEVEAQADADPDLTLVATSGPWHTPYEGTTVVTTWKVYLIKDVSMVAPLTEQPSVLRGVGPQQTSWLPVALRWYDDPADWSHELVSGGPSSWPRQSASAALADAARRLPSVQVSDIRTTTDTIRFHVDRTGVPVLVRTSYFPNWHAQGALGPWRAEPNLMVVVPTSHDVTLDYGSTPEGEVGVGLGFIGLVVVVLLLRRRSRFPW